MLAFNIESCCPCYAEAGTGPISEISDLLTVEIVPFWVHGNLDSFWIPFRNFEERMRSSIGEKLDLGRDLRIWENFQIWWLQPQLDSNIWQKFVIIDLPGDSLLTNPLVLLDIHRGSIRLLRRVFPVQSPTNFFLLVHDLGLEDQCILLDRTVCKITIAGEILRPNHHLKYVFGGAHVKVSLNEDTYCPSRHPLANDGTDLLSLMQLDHVQQGHERRVSDEVFRILADSGNRWNIDWRSGAVISLWSIFEHLRESSSAERRVFLSLANFDWTITCEQISGIWCETSRLKFFIVQPDPPLRTFRRRHPHVVAIQHSAFEEGFSLVVADVWRGPSSFRTAIQFHTDDTLLFMIENTLRYHGNQADYQLLWSCQDGPVEFGPRDQLKLPVGSFVDIFLDSFEQEDFCDEVLLFQTERLPQPMDNQDTEAKSRVQVFFTQEQQRRPEYRDQASRASFFHEEELVQEILLSSIGNFCGTLTIHTYGLGYDFLGKRSFTMSIDRELDISEIQLRILELWHDKSPLTQRVRLVFFRPQPFGDRHVFHLIAEFAFQGHRTPVGVFATSLETEPDIIHVFRAPGHVALNDILQELSDSLALNFQIHNTRVTNFGRVVEIARPLLTFPGQLFFLEATDFDPTVEDSVSLMHFGTYRAFLHADIVEETLRESSHYGCLIFRVWQIQHHDDQDTTSYSGVLDVHERNEWKATLRLYGNYANGIFQVGVRPQPRALGFGFAEHRHVIVHSEVTPHWIPLLLDCQSEMRFKRLATLFQTREGRCNTADLFDRYIPEHRCFEHCTCEVDHEGEKVGVPASLILSPGNYVKITETCLAEEDETSTTCSTKILDESDIADFDNEENILLQTQHLLSQPEYWTTVPSDRPRCHRQEMSLKKVLFDFAVQKQSHPRQKANFVSSTICHGVPCPYCAEANILPFWSLLAFRKLRPPGNPLGTYFCTLDFETMDEWCRIDNGFLIFDAILPQQKQTIELNKHLDLPPPSRLNLPELGEAFQSIMLAYHCHWPSPLPCEEDLPLSTLQFLEVHHPKQINEATRIEIYTDGSFCKSQDQASWAFVVFGYDANDTVFPIHAAWGPLTLGLEPNGTGAPKHGSREGEAEGLIRALIWRIASSVDLSVSFRFDSTITGFATSGDWHIPPGHTQMRFARSLALLSETMFPGQQQFQHVKAHAGCHGNEIADCLSKLARIEGSSFGHNCLNVQEAIADDPPACDWFWLWIRGWDLGDDLPSANANNAIETKPMLSIDTHKVFPENLLNQHQNYENKTVEFALGFATYNVQTLSDGSTGASVTCYEFLRRQVQSHHIHICCLQETRTRSSGLTVSNSHLRLSSSCVAGKGGVEIWLLRFLPGKSRELVSKKDIVVLCADNETLLIRVTYNQKNFLVASAHGPHSARPAEEITDWWQNFQSKITKFFQPNKEDLLIGIDANAHFAHEIPGVIGTKGLEQKTNLAGRLFETLLMRFNMCLPTTFDWIHSGDDSTWRRSKHTGGARCDYICVPSSWAEHEAKTTLLCDLDAGSSALDHTAVGGWFTLRFFAKKRLPCKHFDRDKIKTLSSEQLARLPTEIPQIPWHLNVHEHAVQLTQALNAWLCKELPVAKAKPKSSYIQEPTWNLRSQRLTWQRKLRSAKQVQFDYYRRIALLAWRWRKSLIEVDEQVWYVLFFAFKAEREAKNLLANSKHELRKLLRHDRNHFLENLAQTAQAGKQEDFHRTLRQAGVVSRKKRQGALPLPRLENLDGSIVTSFDEWVERWRMHFAMQEDGIAVDPLSLAKHAIRPPVQCDLSWEQLPSIFDYENALRRTKMNRSFFYDGLPGDFLHRAVGVLSRICFPLFLKQGLTCREPVLFKGGRLCPLFKGKGNPASCDSFRSIFVSPVLGKVHHRLFRERLMTNFEHFAQPLQLGGRKHKSVMQASHALQLQLANSKARGFSCSVIFLDIRSAFYKLVRRHTTDMPFDRRSLAQLFADLNLDAATFQEFEAFSNEETALDAAKVPSHIQQVVSDALDCTWFVIEGNPIFTQTRCGSRPGDNFADALFGFAFAKVIGRVLDRLKSLGVARHVMWSGLHEPVPSN